MTTIDEIFSDLGVTELDCGLTLIDDGQCISAVHTSDVADWIDEHGDGATDDADGYSDFCQAVDYVASTIDGAMDKMVATIRSRLGDEAANEVEAELI